MINMIIGAVVACVCIFLGYSMGISKNNHR